MKKIKLLVLFALLHVITFAQPSPTEGIYLNGSDDFEPNDTSHINGAITERTIEGWFKVNNSTNKQFIYKEGGGLRGINIFIQNGYLVLGGFNNTDYTPKWLGTFFRKPVNNNTWYHFALVFETAFNANSTNYNITNNTHLKFYLNGGLQIEKSGYKMYAHLGDILVGSSKNGTRVPNIGSGSWSSETNADYLFNSSASENSNNYFTGRVYGFRIWNSARTATEINDNKNILINSVGENSLVAALLNNAFLYLNNSNLTSTAYINTPTNYVWSNGINSVWSNSGNWNTNGIPPNTYDKVKINSNATNFPVLSSDIFIGELDLQNNTTITISSGVTLTVAYKFKNNGKIIIEDGGSFIYEPNLAAPGDFEVNRNSPILDQYFYSYWSTPVAESDSSPAVDFVNYPLIYKFNANQDPTNWDLNAGANFIPGNGYAVRYDNAIAGKQEITFNGTANNGNIDVELFYNPSHIDPASFGSNLLGNPYPSALDWAKFTQDAENTDILGGTAYIWHQTIGTNVASDYITCVGNSVCSDPTYGGKIASGQGFFVVRTDPLTNPGTDNMVTFKNSHRVQNENQDFKFSTENTAENKSWFTMTKDNLTDFIHVGFQNEATVKYDNLYDGIYKSSNTTLGFYSLIDSDKMAVQTLSELNANISVPLGYIYDSSGTITIALNKDEIDLGFDIILENTYTHQFINLRKESYSFIASENTLTEINNQFILHFRNNILSENAIELSTKDVIVYTKNDYLYVKAPLSINTMMVYDIKGRLIMNKKQNFIYIGNLAKGVYFVNIILENNQKVFKKIIF